MARCATCGKLKGFISFLVTVATVAPAIYGLYLTVKDLYNSPEGQDFVDKAKAVSEPYVEKATDLYETVAAKVKGEDVAGEAEDLVEAVDNKITNEVNSL